MTETMENNQPRNSGKSSGNGKENDPNQRDVAKFDQDNDDFTRSQDNLDGESNMSTGGESSGTPYEGLGRRTNYADDMDDQNESRQSTGTNDREKSQATNDEEDSDDWNPRNL